MQFQPAAWKNQSEVVKMQRLGESGRYVDSLTVSDTSHVLWRAMTIRIAVVLMSGRKADLDVTPGCSVEELRIRAQQMLGVRGRLLSASGTSLHGDFTVQQAGLRSGDWLTLHTRPLLLSATSAAVAAVLSDGSVVTWGESDMGGDSGVVPLDDVRHIEATQSAFAVIRDDGSVVTWGRPRWGGDSSAVVERLKDWVLVREFNLSYHKKETILFTLGPYYGN